MNKFIKDKDTKQLITALTISGLIIATFVIVLLNLNGVKNIISDLFTTFRAFVWGGLFALILFRPTQIMENTFLKKLPFKTKRLLSSLIATLGLVIIFVIVAIVLVPSLLDSVASLSKLITEFATNPKSWIDDLQKTFKLSSSAINQIYEFSSDLIQGGWSFLQSYMPNILSATIETFTGIVNFIIGFIICLYILIDRRLIAISVKKISTLFLKKNEYKKGRHFMYLAVEKFSNFFSGKILDSLIIGIICFIAMLFIDRSYAVLIAVIVGITNIVPFFGPFIGAIPCSIILLLVSPSECFAFVIMIVILQQIDGNIIGPKILGDSVGLSSLWIIFAILIGGSLFGFFGMLLSVPICSVIYYMLKEYIDNKIEEKKNAS